MSIFFTEYSILADRTFQFQISGDEIVYHFICILFKLCVCVIVSLYGWDYLCVC